MSEFKVVSMEPTAEMVEAAQDAYMPFGDMDIALRMALLAAPAVQPLYTAPQPAPDVSALAEALESILHGSLLDVWGNRDDDGISSAISMGIQRDSLQRWRKIARQALDAHRKQGGVA